MKRKFHGKVIGSLLGFAMTGSPLGALLGMAIGHAHDNRPNDADVNFWNKMSAAYGGYTGNPQQAAFTMGVIVLGAKMAKTDGPVTRAEVEAFKRVFRIHPGQEENVGRLFDVARRSPEGFEPYAKKLAQIFRRRPIVLEQVLSGLFIIAAADNANISPAEIRYLEKVASLFHFTAIDFIRIAARSGIRLGGAKSHADGTHAPAAKPVDQSYAILGLSERATVVEIKTAYRALIRQHHPDKLVAQGMAPEFIATATEKMKRINAAYEDICRAKGIK